MTDERRTHSTISKLGVEELVAELLKRGVTYEQISERLSTEHSLDISKSAVGRFAKTLNRKYAHLERMKMAAEGIAATMKDSEGNLDTRMSDTLIATTQYALLDRVTDEDATHKEIAGLVMAASQTVRAKSTLESLKATERQRFARAWDLVIQESRQLLSQSDIWPEVEAILLKGREQAVPDE